MTIAAIALTVFVFALLARVLFSAVKWALYGVAVIIVLSIIAGIFGGAPQ